MKALNIEASRIKVGDSIELLDGKFLKVSTLEYPTNTLVRINERIDVPTGSIVSARVLPIRIQRKRTKGYKMPPNTVSVARPHKWGNPLKVEDGEIYVQDENKQWHYLCEGDLEKMLLIYKAIVRDDYDAIREFRSYHLEHAHGRFRTLFLDELKDKNLACFCPLDKPCHADILLEFVNE